MVCGLGLLVLVQSTVHMTFRFAAVDGVNTASAYTVPGPPAGVFAIPGSPSALVSWMPVSFWPSITVRFTVNRVRQMVCAALLKLSTSMSPGATVVRPPDFSSSGPVA